MRASGRARALAVASVSYWPGQRCGRRVAILALGSLGDVQPFVALGRGLAARGTAVRVVSSDRFAPLVREAGLDHATLGVDPEEVLRGEAAQAWLASRNPLTFVRGFRSVVAPMAERLLSEAYAGCAGADAIITPTMGFIGYHIAQRLGCSCVFVHMQPGEPTAALPNPLLTGARHLGRLGNRASYSIVEQVSWQLLRPIVEGWRRRELQLPPLPRTGPYRRVRRARLPVLAAFSPAVVPVPPDWGPYVHVTGYWFADREPAPNPRLVDFVQAGPPPVYVGFGSMTPGQTEALRWVVREALDRCGLRAVVLGDPATEPSDAHVLVVPYAPHGWLFPRVAAVVHHGGAGTTAAGLRAGTPSLICPFFSDQPFWGLRVQQLGAGPAPLPARRLRPQTLAAAIDRAVHDRRMRERANALGGCLRAEDGVRQACDVVDAWLATPSMP